MYTHVCIYCLFIISSSRSRGRRRHSSRSTNNNNNNTITPNKPKTIKITNQTNKYKQYNNTHLKNDTRQSNK